jgi:hypothetical protein
MGWIRIRWSLAVELRATPVDCVTNRDSFGGNPAGERKADRKDSPEKWYVLAVASVAISVSDPQTYGFTRLLDIVLPASDPAKTSGQLVPS